MPEPRPLLQTGAEELRQLQELRTGIDDLMAEIRRRQPAGAAPDADDLRECCNWARQVAAQAGGYLKEFKIYKQHRDKLRGVYGPRKLQELRKNHQYKYGGDLLIGNTTAANAADPFSKTMQIKSIVTDDRDPVLNHIRKGLQQLASSGGEKPRPKDRWIVSLYIQHAMNPFPFLPTDLPPANSSIFRVKLRDVVLNEVWSGLHLTKKQGSLKLKPEQKNTIKSHAIAKDTFEQNAQWANRARTTALNRATGNARIFTDVVIKVYYMPEYGLGNQSNVSLAVVRLVKDYTNLGLNAHVILYDSNRMQLQ